MCRQADGAPIDESQPVGEERDSQGNFPRANVERARSSMLQDAGRAMRRMYEVRTQTFPSPSDHSYSDSCLIYILCAAKLTEGLLCIGG